MVDILIVTCYNRNYGNHTYEGSDKVNFDDLSVSGRVLNAYNALLMAEKLTTN